MSTKSVVPRFDPASVTREDIAACRGLRIAILGQQDETRPPRRTIKPAISHAANTLGLDCSAFWLNNIELAVGDIDTFDAIFLGPGGPDEDIKDILSWIRHAREKGIPTLGTCGGFQRILTEFALNVLQQAVVRHQEIESDAQDALFTGLSCQVIGEAASVVIVPDTLAARCYQNICSDEYYYCRFGINPTYVSDLSANGMCVSGFDIDGTPRIIELTSHPFLMGTLFVPQVQSTPELAHPLIRNFLLAAVNYQRLFRDRP